MKRINGSDISFARNLILEAGDLALRVLGTNNATEWKSDNTPVTTLDKHINSLVIERVRGEYPDDRVYGEEESVDGDSGYTWVVDPYDGTQSLGLFPTGTICLARLGSDGLPLFSFVHNPITKELFAARHGSAATLNDKLLRVSQSEQLKGSYVFLGSRMPGTVASNGTLYDRLEARGAKVINVRSLAFGCCMVAAGKAGGAFIGVRTPFEAAAVKLLVEGAGGLVTDLAGNPADGFRYDGKINGLVISNRQLHDQLLAILAKAP
jgi:fructose-1,6-bisphosphatase/inositol monophosphatase family enzyme